MLPPRLLVLSLASLLSVGFCQTQTDPVNDDYTCSSTQACKIGCCSIYGVCGMGPTFCGAGNCTSSCDAKSECDAGWGPSWSAAEKCPLNVCCSQFGFCGTTPDFCGTSTVTKPSCPGGTSSNQRVMAYYEGWSTTRACGGIFPEDLSYTSFSMSPLNRSSMYPKV
jgi:chitinase